MLAAALLNPPAGLAQAPSDQPGLKGGIAVGETNSDGTNVETEPYSSQDLMATVCKGLGISLETTFTSKNGRPMKIANGGKVIKELIA